MKLWILIVRCGMVKWFMRWSLKNVGEMFMCILMKMVLLCVMKEKLRLKCGCVLILWVCRLVICLWWCRK